jgi:hypothetical protein
MSVVSINIRHGATVILSWTIIEGYSEGCMFLDRFEGVKSDKFDLGNWSFPEKLRNADVSVAIGKTKNECDPAIITSKVAVTTPIFGQYIKYTLSENTSNPSAHASPSDEAPDTGSVAAEVRSMPQATRDLNDVLLMGARKLALPESYGEDGKVGNNKWVVYNKIL